jgi:long-subunit fatty acid transport protein
MPSRNASVETDAVYYNPAGLTKLNDGFHVSLSNQFIWQTREVGNDYTHLHENLYTGKVTALLFPSIYAVYKIKNFAFSLGFMPVGGGGGATYDKGLPSFEMSQSDLVPQLALSPLAATDYSMDIYFKGSSTFLGYQGTVSYKIADWLSIAAGARYVTAKNKYEGYLRNVQVNTAIGWLPASLIMDMASDSAAAGSTRIQPLHDGGLGGQTAQYIVDNYPAYLSAAQRDALYAGLMQLGVTGDVTTFTIDQSIAAFNGKAIEYAFKSTLLSDQSADATQTGHGITPIISVNISPTDNLNIAIKYEMKTKIEVTNKTKEDLKIGYTATGTPITQFPDGEKIRNDMPAMLAIGIDYSFTKFKVAAGMDYYFDKSADYGHYVDADLNPTTPETHIDNKDIIDHNGYALEAGLEYNISKSFLLSTGYIFANKGVKPAYQSDLTFANATHTLGLGGAYSLLDGKLKINLGAGYTWYIKDDRKIDHVLVTTNMLPTETYKKSTFMLGVGLDFRF